MRKLATGIAAGLLLMVCAMIFMGAAPAQEDSIKVYMDRLENLLRKELSRATTAGRFQLQSFSIERTHWHYMMDTATGKLYMLEMGRTPDRSEWTLIANGMVEEQVPAAEPLE